MRFILWSRILSALVMISYALKNDFVLLLLGEVLYKCQFEKVCLIFVQVFYVLTDFISTCSIDYWERGGKIPTIITEKINEISWFLRKVNKIDKPLASLIKRKTEKERERYTTHITNLKNERENNDDELTGIKTIIKKYTETLCTKFGNTNEIEIFIENRKHQISLKN